jgi:hypothetical protein
MQAKALIQKVLSANDLGLTGSHQAGIHVPRSLARSGYLPELDERAVNPREELTLRTQDMVATCHFIFYNNRLRGGTRYEYRITRLAKLLHVLGAKVGDALLLEREDYATYSVSRPEKVRVEAPRVSDSRSILRISGTWVVIPL